MVFSEESELKRPAVVQRPHSPNWCAERYNSDLSKTCARASHSMTLIVAYGCRAKTARRDRAASNLYALLPELTPAQQILLDALNTTFEFQREERERRLGERTIGLNLKEFNRFQYEQRPIPPPNQRWAIASLKEAVIQFLDDHVGFTQRWAWRRAARRELNTPNLARHRVCEAQRVCDSSHTWIKLSPAELALDRSLFDKIVDFISGASEPAFQLLVDLLLARDHLGTTLPSPEAVRDLMQKAFPNTYALALEFEQVLALRAARVAMRHPKHAGQDPTTAIDQYLAELHGAWRTQRTARLKSLSKT
jgi:hypothetical protein